MLIAYIDETGDTGPACKKGSSSCYVLGCILIRAEDWRPALDKILDFRRHIRQDYQIPMRAELKANFLIRKNGPLKNLELTPPQRQVIYRCHLQQLALLHARAFAVVVDKAKMNVSGICCLGVTWETMLQRLQRTSHYDNTDIFIVHDDGENNKIRGYVRKARRHLTAGRMFGGGSLNFEAEHFVGDPIPRDSQQSYFIQLADMVAYSAWRTHMPPSRNVAKVVPATMWNTIGTAIYANVNSWKLNGSVPGVVLRTY